MVREKDKNEEGGPEGNPTLTSLFIAAQPALFTHISTLLGGDVQTAQDVLQDTNALIWERRAQYNPLVSSFLTWAKACATTVVMTARKKAQREGKRLVYSEDVFSQVAEKESAVQESPNDMVLALRHCMKQLPPKDRFLLKRRYEDRLDLSALADEWLFSLSALTMKLMRLRKKLASCIKKQLCQLDTLDEELDESFCNVMENALDWNAGPDARGRLDEALRTDPRRLDAGIDQIFTHSLLFYSFGRRRQQLARFRALFEPALKIAALLAVVFTGAAAAWHGHTRPTAFLPPENKTVLAATERHPMAVKSQPSILPNVSPRETSFAKKQEQQSLSSPIPNRAWKAAESSPMSQAAIAPTLQAQEKEKMNTTKLAAAVTTAAVAALGVSPAVVHAEGSGNDTSLPVSVIAAPDHSPFWRTFLSRTPKIVWEWSSSATHAVLTVTDMAGKMFSSNTYDKAESPLYAVTLTLPLPDSANMESEDLYTLKLVFDNGETLTASLADVAGVNGTSARCVATSNMAVKAWAKTGRSAVLPIAAGVDDLVLNGAAKATGLDGAEGWYGWCPIPIGSNTAAFAASGVTTTANLVRFPSGTVIMLK